MKSRIATLSFTAAVLLASGLIATGAATAYDDDVNLGLIKVVLTDEYGERTETRTDLISARTYPQAQRLVAYRGLTEAQDEASGGGIEVKVPARRALSTGDFDEASAPSANWTPEGTLIALVGGS